MAKIQTIIETIDFARELAFELEMRSELPSENEILGALQIMDAQLQ